MQRGHQHETKSFMHSTVGCFIYERAILHVQSPSNFSTHSQSRSLSCSLTSYTSTRDRTERIYATSWFVSRGRPSMVKHAQPQRPSLFEPMWSSISVSRKSLRR